MNIYSANDLVCVQSASIIFTVFFFGASTYYTLHRQQRYRQRCRDDNMQDLTLTAERLGANTLMTSLLDSDSLDFREENIETPPWVSVSHV